MFTRKFLEIIPKTDLHVHLDGSLRLGTLIELAQKQNILLPSYSKEGLAELVFKDVYADLEEYLRGFAYTTAVMGTPEALEQVAYEFAFDNFEEGVRYVEPRFAPQRHANAFMSIDDVIFNVNNGLERAKKEINSKKEIQDGSEPRFEYGIICCGMRMFTKEYSAYYRQLFDLHKHMPAEDLYTLAAVDLVRTMIDAREAGIPIAGFDLAGAEAGYPAEDYRRAYDLAHKNFIKKTLHAGEAYGPASIFQAITDCHADRIGHGTHLFDDTLVNLPTEKQRKKYVRELWQYIADRRISIEVCLTSNLQTMPNMKDISMHPFKQMIDNRLSVTFCTDNRLVSHTTVTDELMLAVKNYSISLKKLKDIIAYGFKRSFYPGDYMEKRAYIRSIIDYYEKLESAHNFG